MDTIVVELDPQTSERARRLAQARGTTINALVQSLIAQLDRSEVTHDSVPGLFADEPALLDQMVDQAMQTRETQPLRLADA
jgi:predicted transcriptional regulator